MSMFSDRKAISVTEFYHCEFVVDAYSFNREADELGLDPWKLLDIDKHTQLVNTYFVNDIPKKGDHLVWVSLKDFQTIKGNHPMLATDYKIKVIDKMTEMLCFNKSFDQVKVFDHTVDHLNLVAQTKVIAGGEIENPEAAFAMYEKGLNNCKVSS